MAKKRILTLVMSVALLLAVTIGGTLAYLTDTDEEVNVMTLGNVQIDLIEQQRGENGLVDFVDGKELTPLVGSAQGAKDGYGMPTASNYVDKIVTVKNTGKSPAYVRVWVAVPAALEQADNANGPLHWNLGNRFDAENKGSYNDGGSENFNPGYADIAISGAIAIEIDGIAYNAYTFTYKTALAAGEVTKCPAITGFYLDSAVDNYVNADGELVYTFNGKDVEFDLTEDVEIPVFAQAVQAAGFGDANAAFDAAFGAPAKDNHPWMPKADHYVSTLDELKAAFAEGGTIMLMNDIEIDKITTIEPGVEVYLNMNGKTITVDENTTSNTMIYVKDGAKLVVDGNGTIDMGAVKTMAIFCPGGELVIENGTFIRDSFTAAEVTNATTGLFMGIKSSDCNVTINGGYFDAGYYDENAADIEELLAADGEVAFETDADKANRGKPGDANTVRMAIKDNVSVLLNHSGYGTFKVYGGTFVGANPAWGDEGCMLPTTPNYLRPWSYYQGGLLDGQVYNENGLEIPAGYTITRTVNADGIPVYTVSYSK